MRYTVMFILNLPTSFTPISTLFNVCIVLLLFILIKDSYHYPYRMSVDKRFIVKLFVFIFFIFSFWGGDWYHYYDIILSMKLYGENLELNTRYKLIELPYWFIARFFNYDYLLFRVAVWGGAFFFIFKTQKRLELDKNTFLISFIPISMLILSYGRVSLAMALVFYGYSFIVKPSINNALRSYIIGVCLIVFSFFFHESAIFMLAIIPLSNIKLNKKNMTFFFLIFPIMVMLMQKIGIEYILNRESSDIGFRTSSAQRYLTRETSVNGIARKIGDTLSYSVFYLTLWLLVKNIWRKTYNDWPLHIQKFANAAIWVIAISSLFIFLNDVSTNIIYYRLLYFSVIPISVVLSHILLFQYNTQHNRIILYMASMWSIYRVSYAFYASLVS